MSFIIVALWGAFMMGAIFYTQEARHPETKPMAAFVSFVVVFSLAALVAYGLLSLLVRATGQTDSLSHPAAAGAFLLGVFAPAFLLARWQVRKPPRSADFTGQSSPRRF